MNNSNKNMPINLPLDLTIAIPVKNESSNLQQCLNAIGKDFARKIVIIDSGSTDATQEIALKNGIEVIDFQWNGHFPKKRNWYLRHYRPDTQWVLFLDADEYLTPDFRAEVREALAHTTHEGFWLCYSIYFLGKKLKGGYPLKKLALFKTGAGEYERIDEAHWSHLDMEVHEHPVLKGSTGIIRSRIDHQDFRGVSHYVTKHNEYSSWEAARYLKAMQEGSSNAGWTWKQKLKYRLMKTPLIGPVYFIGSFFLLGGFRDGATGLAFAIFKMDYFTQIYCKIRELASRRE